MGAGIVGSIINLSPLLIKTLEQNIEPIESYISPIVIRKTAFATKYIIAQLKTKS
jgi:hypothetical protein